ncbi:MAG: aspartate--tRNA ligase [Patescibacteria group bacterium]
MKRIFIKKTIEEVGKKVKIAGWVNSVRAHGKILFVDLRDKTGLMQIVFSQKNEELYKIAETLRPEWVIEVTGEIGKRPEGMINKDVKTGTIELTPEEIKIYSEAKTIPFSIDGDGYEISEEKRLQYRYIDLRRERLQRNLAMRHNVIQFMREFLKKEEFVEVETPLLTKSTPEGARDFLVPSRINPGSFYALPQSPQQYKQLLMVAGLERYFQIARCLRDEDPRGDRQAEFTQLDIEMSFVDEEDIMQLTEKLYTQIIEKLFPEKTFTQKPFIRMTHKEAIEKYNTDKPDLRKDKNNPNELAFAFVTDFPMFEWHEGTKRWGAAHHPFTQPHTTDIEKIKKNPKDIRARQYDFVLNGFEIGGGSIRTIDLNLLTAVFEVLGHKAEEVREKFKNYFEAFSFGVPPHGGIAPGIDRFLAVVLNEPNIREVIAFPKTGDNRGLMMGTPSEVSEEQLKELHIKIDKK